MGCDLLGSIIPPNNKNRNDYLRLEHIAASYISELLCDNKFARSFLPTVPKKLFILLMQATMVEDFKTQLKTPSKSINQLILHWPYPEFNLRYVTIYITNYFIMFTNRVSKVW